MATSDFDGIDPFKSRDKIPRTPPSFLNTSSIADASTFRASLSVSPNDELDTSISMFQGDQNRSRFLVLLNDYSRPSKVGKKSVSCAPLRPSFLENKSILSPPSQPPPPTPETIKVFAPSELKLQTPSHQQNQPDESPTPHTAIPSKTVRAAIQSPVHRVLRPTAVMDSPFTESGEPTIRRCRRVGQNPYLASTPQPPAPLESTPVTVKRRKSPNSTLIVDDHFGGIMMPPPPSSTPVTVVKRPRRNAATSRPPTTSQYSTEPMEQSGGGRYNLRSRSRASSILPSTDSSLSAINSTATSFNTPVAKTSTRSKRKGPAMGLELSVDGQKSYMSTRRKRKTSALQDSQTQFSAEDSQSTIFFSVLSGSTSSSESSVASRRSRRNVCRVNYSRP
uniref:Uncharacterized protein n=2 Tax=Schistocephalus solidus TaxID=70667 RepID=A0A0X3NMB9_SCHSO